MSTSFNRDFRASRRKKPTFLALWILFWLLLTFAVGLLLIGRELRNVGTGCEEEAKTAFVIETCLRDREAKCFVTPEHLRQLYDAEVHILTYECPRAVSPADKARKRP